MRASIAALGSISILFVGVVAISESAQQADPEVSSQAGNESFQLATDVFGGIGQAGVGIVWFGVAAVVLIALGMLVVAGQQGGR